MEETDDCGRVLAGAGAACRPWAAGMRRSEHNRGREGETERCGRTGHGVEDLIDQSSNAEGVRTMSSMEQATIVQPSDEAFASVAHPGQHSDGMPTTRHAGRLGRLAERALPVTPWRRALITLCLAFAGVGLAGQSAQVPLAHAAGNADAAHACQQGGYATLTGISSGGQTITFKNEGDCVSYAAHGGKFTTPIPTCTVTATTGCLTFNGVTLPSVRGTGNSITLTGATTFDTTCDECVQSVPNALATGGGDYVETNSSGSVISQGIFRLADTAGFGEGLLEADFFDSNGTNLLACSAAPERLVKALATLIDRSSGAAQTVFLGAVTDSISNFNGAELSQASDTFEGPVPSTAITC
jgi:hypothetical protein